MADLINYSGSPHNGTITAALFLQEFIEKDILWVYFDLFAWNKTSLPGRHKG